MKKRKPIVLKYIPKQTGKRRSIRSDRKRHAMLPGKRISKRGKIYYETRRNRSDKKGKRI